MGISGEFDQAEQITILELPENLRGLEALVDSKAARLSGAEPGSPEYLAWVDLVVGDIQRRVDGYYALGQIATNPDSLPYRLVHGSS